MTRRRKIVYTASALTLLIGAVGSGLFFWHATELERTYGRVKLGMTAVEVTEAIGEPVPFESSPDWCFNVTHMKQAGVPFGKFGEVARTEIRTGPGWCICVAYDSSDRVAGAYLLYYDPSLLDRLRDLIGL